MTTPARSPIADAAARAETAWLQSEEARQQALTRARTALTPILPGVPLTALQMTVEPAGLVIVTDGVVTLGVRADGTVWTVRSDRSVTSNEVVTRWVQERQVTTARELAAALPREVMRGRDGRA